jgi:hypothetical protein
MKKPVVVALLSVFISVPAAAAGSRNSVGVNYGFDLNGVVGIQGELDLSAAMPNKAPVRVQLFWKNYAQRFQATAGTFQYSYNGFGAVAIYDFGAAGKMGKRFKPYAGLGLITLNSSLSGPNGPVPRSADSGGLYLTGGFRYEMTPRVSADLNVNNYGGLTVGAILDF